MATPRNGDTPPSEKKSLVAEHTKNQNITAEKRLLTWPVGALACAVCLLAGLVIGLLLGRNLETNKAPKNRTASPTLAPTPPRPPASSRTEDPKPSTPRRMPHRFAAEIISVRQQVFAREKEQLFAAPPHKLYYVLHVRLALLTDAPARVSLLGADVQLVTDSGIRYASLGVLPKAFDWTDPEALLGPATRRTERLTPDAAKPVTPRLLFLVPEGIRPFSLNIRGAKTALIRPGTVTEYVAARRLSAGVYRRDELGAFHTAGAPQLAVALDNEKASYELVVRRKDDFWKLRSPALQIGGWLVPGGGGHYSGELEDDNGEKLPVAARVLTGGKTLLLYLTEKPHGALLFRWTRPATRPATSPAAP